MCIASSFKRRWLTAFAALGFSLFAAAPAYAFDIDIADATTPDESAVSQTIAVFISSAQSGTVTVNYAITDGTATDGDDYTASSSTLTFAPGETVKDISIPILADALDEEDETVIITLSNASSGTIVDTTATLTITDDDAPPQLSIADNSTAESSGSFTLAATLDTPSSKQVTVDWRVVGNTATDGSDFTAATGSLTFAPNSVSENITITLLDDTLDEDDETLTISLYNPTAATIDNGTATLTLTDDDAEPAITIADLTTADENTATVTLSLSAASAKSVAVLAATNPVTAGDPGDYTGVSTNITFNPGSTQQTLAIALVNDTTDENNETFEVQLSSPVNASISDNLSVVTISDDDAPPSLSIAAASASDDNTTLSATVTLSAASALQVDVNYATADGTATAGNDYTSDSGTLTFTPGQTSQSIPVSIFGDVIDEEDENFTITLSGASNASIASAQATMTITDNDAAPTISIADNTTADESAGNSLLTVSLSAASERNITVAYSSSDGTASAGDDYTAASGSLTFAPNVTSQTITIPVLADTKDEDDESVTVTLSNPSNASLNDAVGVLTITDDDNAPTISIDDLTTSNEAGVAHTISVRLSAASQKSISVNYATANGDAMAVSDYVSASGTVNFAAGSSQEQITINIVDDQLDETNETFTIGLSGATNASITDNSSTITITDDDGMPSLLVQDITTSNEAAGPVTAVIALSAASALPVTVDYATADGDASAGNDYTALSSQVTFAAGETSKNIDITILADSVNEDNEHFSFNLSNPVNAAISDNSSTITITDDDTAPAFSISDNTTADETAGTATLSVSLDAASEKTVTVAYTTTNGTASAASDYTAISGTLTFAPGITSQPVSVAVLGDNADESDETVIITLSNPSNASITDSMGVLTITDDDNQPGITISDFTTPNEVAVSQNITLSLSAASQLPVTVDWATQDITASASNDYSAGNGTVTFPAGSTSQTIAVQILDDAIDETNETFAVNLSNASNAVISDNSSEVTITDDDTLSVTIADVTIPDESAVARTFTVTLSNPSANVITVDYATQDNSTTASTDYTPANGTLTFNAGVTSQTFTVSILDDAVQEGTEVFAVNLSNATGGATITVAQALATIIDDDGSADLTIADLSASENAGTATATVSLSYAMPIAVTVNWQTSDNTALAGADYVANNGSLTFAAGNTSQTISLTLISDTSYEGNENFTVTLSNPVNATLADATATITITEDDQPLSTTETNELRQNLVFGKNSIARAETQFMNRVLTRNRNLLFSGNQQNTQPTLSFQNLNVDWNDHAHDLDAIFSIDDLSSDASRNISWETAISHSKNASGVKNTSVSTAFNFSHRLSESAMFGYILGFGYSDTAMSGSMIGSNVGSSASIGLYSSYKIGESLILDLMAAQTYESNTLDTKMGSKTVKGDFDRTSTVFSTSLQGVYKFATAELRPTFTYSAGKSVFSNAYFDISQSGLTSTQQIDFGTDEYYALSFEPELKMLIGNKAQLIRPSGFNMMKLRPKYFCEKYNRDAEERCGRGIGVTLANHHPTYHYSQDLSFDYEKIADTKTYSLRYKRIY